MTFDKEFTASIEEFKSMFLPLLKGFNDSVEDAKE
jgi:hypothetical protein